VKEKKSRKTAISVEENILSFYLKSTAKFLSCTCKPPRFYKRKEEREKES